MKLTPKDSKSALAQADLVAVLCPEKGLVLPPGVAVPSQAKKDFVGEFRQLRSTYATSGPVPRVLFVGLGKKDEVDPERIRRAAALAVKAAEARKLSSLAIWVSPKVEAKAGGAEAAGCAVAEGAIMGNYTCVRFKSKPTARLLKSVAAYGTGAPFRKGAKRGIVLAEANCFTRDLQDAPGNLMRPRDLVAQARRLAKKSAQIRVTALNEAAMGKLGMGSLLSVSRGSQEPAYLIHLTYKPKGTPKGKIAVVGKGLTFDAGGISLKPPAKMDEMKYDMSGGAAVLGVFHALSGLDVPYEVHGLVPTSENLPDGKANKPGDVVKAMNGTTIEVLNTDAEGRLILADAMAYASKKIKPDTMIDMATLTGAVIVALGHEFSGVMSASDKLVRDLVHAGQDVGEEVWRLPLAECHKTHLKGRVADLRNINAGQGAGSTAGAAFLSHFVDEKIEWAHLDIAGSAWGGDDRDYVGGPTGSGVGVRLIMRYLEKGKK